MDHVVLAAGVEPARLYRQQILSPFLGSSKQLNLFCKFMDSRKTVLGYCARTRARERLFSCALDLVMAVQSCPESCFAETFAGRCQDQRGNTALGLRLCASILRGDRAARS